jgi:hypothetical protein
MRGGTLDTCDGEDGRVSGRCMGSPGDDDLDADGGRRCVRGSDAGMYSGVGLGVVRLFGGANGALVGMARLDWLVPGRV